MFEKKIKETMPNTLKEFKVLYLDGGAKELPVQANEYSIDSDEGTLNFENEDGDIIATFNLNQILGVK